MTNQYAVYQVGHDIIGDYADTPDAARQIAIEFTRMDGDAESILAAPLYSQARSAAVGTLVVATREELSERYGVTIEFVGFTGVRAPLDGYKPHDYLPGYASQSFDTIAAANAWIAENHRGPNRDGVNARFIAA